MKKLILILILMLPLAGCTANSVAKNWGGKTTIEIPSTKKFVNMTWKDENLWILTRDRKQGETPETFRFKEDSSFGVMQGEVIIVEK